MICWLPISNTDFHVFMKDNRCPVCGFNVIKDRWIHAKCHTKLRRFLAKKWNLLGKYGVGKVLHDLVISELNIAVDNIILLDKKQTETDTTIYEEERNA